MSMRNLLTFFLQSIRKLNIFPRHAFGSNLTPVLAKRLGQISTRLYFILLLISLILCTVYTVIRPQTITNTFDKPSFMIYTQLYQTYKDELKCPCSRVASPSNYFVTIEQVFHQVRSFFSLFKVA